MKRLTCSALTTGCDAAFAGVSTNDLVVQYVVHAASRHRADAIPVEDVVRAITTADRRSLVAHERQAG